MRDSRASRARRVGLLLGLGALSWIIYTLARSRVLLHNGRAIENHSAHFSRDYFVGAPTARALTYLAMGDSTAAGWGAKTLQTTYPYLLAHSVARRGFRVHVVNVAVGGATLRDVKNNQLNAIEKTRPDLISLGVGANDATHFTNLTAFKTQLQTVVAQLEQSSARTILVANTPDMSFAPALPLPISAATARRARAQNAILDETIQNSRLQKVDLFGRGPLDAKENPNFYAADWFHPAAPGYAKWADLFIRQQIGESHRVHGEHTENHRESKETESLRR